MKANFIQKLYESEIQNTELALATEAFSDEIQSIIEKVTNLKTKELADLVKKIKYDGKKIIRQLIDLLTKYEVTEYQGEIGVCEKCGKIHTPDFPKEINNKIQKNETRNANNT